jgi:hypothetical protein
MVHQNETKRRRPLWLKALIGLILLFILIVSLIAIALGPYIYDHHSLSSVFIWNVSGLDVRFEKIAIDDQIIWKSPDIIIESRQGLGPPRPDNRRHGILLDFRAPKKSVQFKLVTVNLSQERETLSCVLNNQSRPCLFEVFYHKGRLNCSDCGDELGN